MIRSMTGFGKAEVIVDNKKFNLELRSLNSKQLDLSLRLPNEIKSLEFEIRNKISQAVLRGKADFLVQVEGLTTKQAIQLDEDLVKSYHKQLEELSYKMALKLPENILGVIARFPGVFSAGDENIQEDTVRLILQAVDQTLRFFDEFRLQEGLGLKNELLGRVNVILQLLDQVEPFELQRSEFIRVKLMKHFADLPDNAKFDANRFEQELIYYLEKLDITEEKVRLKQHCDYFSETIDEENAGKKLGFITQEIGREINTLGSKANDASIQRLVVQMKDELEKMKEQLFNIL